MKMIDSSKTTYATLLFPGSFYPEESVKKVKNRELGELDIPQNCFAVQFFDLVTAKFDVDGQIIETTSKRFNESDRFYINATVMNQEEVAKEHGENSTILGNMQSNRWDEVVKCVTGNFQPFEKEDSIVTA